MFDNVPQHIQLQYANTTLNWCSTDSEQEFQKNLKNSQQYELLDKNGWIDRNIEYSFNSYGFRSREIDISNPGFAVFGCSFTSGIGLPVDELWPVRLSKELSIPVDNFGGTQTPTALPINKKMNLLYGIYVNALIFLSLQLM